MGLQAKSNSNFDISDDVVLQKLASINTLYLDDMYATLLALANISSEVWLGTDADDNSMDVLINKPETELNKITMFEIPNNIKITDGKLQTLLKKLTNLQVLIADGSNLKSFNFIEGTNNTIQFISVLETSINNLKDLEKCNKLSALRINTLNLNLKPYSGLISDICERNYALTRHLKCGNIPSGGINTTAEILNTLNGKKEEPNVEFTCFNDYSGRLNKNSQEINFSYTGLTTIRGMLWDDIKIILPSCFENYYAGECVGAILDYRNLDGANEYNSVGVSSLNSESFKGYTSVISYVGNVITIVGSNTLNLKLGSCKRQSCVEPTLTFDLASIAQKAPNITNMTIYGALGFTDITVLSPLKLTTLEIQYSSLYKLKSDETVFGNMGESLTTLKINNCSTFNDLDGLDKLNHITTLDLSNNSSLGDIQTITKPVGTKENKNTCRYIVESLPDLQKVTLKGCELNDFSYLISNGFTETSNGSREFAKN